MTDFQKALQYVKENVEQIDIEHAIHHIDRDHAPLRLVDETLCMKIYDLMEEYGADNDFPEGWWLDECDEDEIIFKLYDLYE